MVLTANRGDEKVSIMDTVKLLIQGYARKKENGRWDATSATVLIQSAGKLALIDPGVNPSELIRALKNEQLSPEDIDIVAVSHSHYDHARNTRLFEKDKIFDLSPLFRQRDLPAKPLMIPNTNIEIIITPGHVDKHAAFLVDTNKGKYAVSGDVFWWEDREQQKVDPASLISHKDPVAKNDEILQNSRLKLLEIADYIIPGHGEEFAVPK
jgi:glyoxylase-like metal-dependent hydrolase (beta-lactamase superfamily II)